MIFVLTVVQHKTSVEVHHRLDVLRVNEKFIHTQYIYNVECEACLQSRVKQVNEQFSSPYFSSSVHPLPSFLS